MIRPNLGILEKYYLEEAEKWRQINKFEKVFVKPDKSRQCYEMNLPLCNKLLYNIFLNIGNKMNDWL